MTDTLASAATSPPVPDPAADRPDPSDARAQRIVIGASMTGNAGYGLLSTITVLYFSTHLHLAASRIGLALTVAGACAMLLGIPAGRLADTTVPPRLGAALSYLLLAATEVCVLTVDSYSGLVIVLVVAAGFQMTAATMRQTIVARLGGPRASVFRAKVLARSNLAMMVGMAASSLVIAGGSAAAYRAAILLCCVLTAVQGLLFLALPPGLAAPGATTSAPALDEPGADGPAAADGPGADGPAPDGPAAEADRAGSRWEAFSDLSYLSVCLIYATLVLLETVVTVALPLWITQHTAGPGWLIAVFGVANTLAIACLLTRTARRVNTPRRAGRAMAVGGVFAGVFCLLTALASGLPVLPAVVVLVIALLASIAAELLTVSAEMELTMTLAPEHAKGQYLGLSQTALTAAGTAGPSLVTLACLTWGRPGWILLGALLTLAGLATPAVAAWAERTRPAP
ncbi:MFS transporter [Streptomyces sp. NRRL B-1347]|uniref:MFS transporter n=1 Tax=Streptomyces sp. NRRL B-1347 TaxID=1476877 RepID=UPI0004C696B5|nr:MFS transporter [Streptomyces sp. NRRL B-1347]